MTFNSIFFRTALLVFAFSILSRLDNDRLQLTHQAYAQEPSNPATAPDIFWEQPEFNFGSTFEDQKVEHTFKFQNKGAGNLEIGDVRGSCGCTAALASAKVIAPGESGSIQVTFDPKNKKGDQTKTVTVQSNDPDSPVSTLVLKGAIKLHFEVDPMFVTFGHELVKGKGSVQKIKVWSGSDGSFELKDIKADLDKVTITSTPIQEGSKTGYELTASLAADTLPGRYAGAIRATTTLASSPNLEIKYFATILGSLNVTPKQAVMGQVALGAESTKTLLIETSEDRPFQISKVETPAPYIVSTLKTLEEGKRYEVAITVTKAAPAGPLRGELVLHTNYADENLVRVPLFGLVGDYVVPKEEEQ